MNHHLNTLNNLHRLRPRKLDLKLPYSILFLILIGDQVLLPMFMFGSISLKLSYLILGIWLFHWSFRPSLHQDTSKDIREVFVVLGIIVVCILFGEIWLALQFTVDSYYETARGCLTFFLAALAFGLGRTSNRFRFEWLFPILYLVITINLMFIVFRNDLPGWLISFYFPQRVVKDVEGFQTVADIVELARPRGISGNPNASMLIVNIIVLFIYLGIRNKILQINSAINASCIIILPIVLAILFASRGEVLVSILLAILNYKILEKENFIIQRVRLIILIGFISTFVAFSSSLLVNDVLIDREIDRLITIGKVLKEVDDRNSGISRPLLALELFQERFPMSPIFGTGISATEEAIFSDGTQHLHNDWMFILIVSGILGTLMLIWLLIKISFRLGWPIIIPFILPGLVNTFMLNIPAFIIYFGLIGALLTSILRRAKSNQKFLFKNNFQTLTN